MIPEDGKEKVMSDNAGDKNIPAYEFEQFVALKRLAHLYHRFGNYEKAEELLRLAEQWKHSTEEFERRANDSGSNAA